MTKVSVGQVVQLNSGGPWLTVVQVMPNHTVYGAAVMCQWYVDGKFELVTLPAAAVRPADEADLKA